MDIKVYKVTPIHPEVCKGCWSRRAEVEVTIGLSNTHSYCQPCANRLITEASEGIERSLAAELNRR